MTFTKKLLKTIKYIEGDLYSVEGENDSHIIL